VGLAEVLLPHPKVVIASDDMYEHILWHEEPFANILNACPALYDRTVVLNGVGKGAAVIVSGVDRKDERWVERPSAD